MEATLPWQRVLSLCARVHHIGSKEWHEAVSQYAWKRSLGRHEDKCVSDSVIEPFLSRVTEPTETNGTLRT